LQGRRNEQAFRPASGKLFRDLFPGIVWNYTDHKAKPLIRAAFALYEMEWKRGQGPGTSYNIDWHWPFDAFKRGEEFTTLEPWTVLFGKVKELLDIHRETRGY
jgi:hypothetical protein